MNEKTTYIPAAGHDLFTRLYDPLVKITCREDYFKRRMADLSDVRPGDRLLDVGCGTGTLLIQIGTNQTGVQLNGLDGDGAILTIAEQKATRANIRVNWIEAFSTSIPFSDNSMDIITCSLLTHHLMRDDKLLTFREMCRVLKPGGFLVFVDWGKPSNLIFRSFFKLIRLLDGHANTYDHLVGHIPQFITNAGFTEVEVKENINTMLGTLNLILAKKT